MTKSRKAPANKRARKQEPKRSSKRAVRREIKGQSAVFAAAREKADDAGDVAIAPARSSKKATIIGLLQREGGAAIGDLTGATGWQTHSVRAALTGLRKEGRELARIKNEGGVTHYRLTAGA